MVSIIAHHISKLESFILLVVAQLPEIQRNNTSITRRTQCIVGLLYTVYTAAIFSVVE